MLQMFPLLVLSLIIYALLGLMMGSVTSPWHAMPAFEIQLMSGDTWQISCGDLFIMFSMFLLFIELVRSTKTGSQSIVNHAFSVIVFVAALLLFVTAKGYGNSVFFMFTSMTLLDFMAGFVVTTVTSRRDVMLGRVSD